MRSPLLATSALGALLFGACGRGEVVFETSNVGSPQTSVPSVPAPSDGGAAATSPTSAPDAGKHHVPVIEFDLDRPRGAAPQIECEAGICPPGGEQDCSTDSECLVGWECEQGTCIWSCDDNRDCTMGWSCDHGECIPETLSPSQL